MESLNAPTLEDMRKLKEKYPSAVNVVSDGLLEMFTYTYANEDLFREKWGKEARGITFERATGRIISRPFHKFFNSSEPMAPKDFSPVTVAEKMDGSLLQVSWDPTNNYLFVASRSTLRKDTSYVINAFWRLPKHVIEAITNFAKEMPDFTHMFELLDPENQIVIYYPELSVTYLMSRSKNDGTYYYMPVPELDAVLWKPVGAKTVDDIVREAQHTEGMEGWVLFDPNLQDFVKIKTPWYLERHKVTELNLPEHYVNAWAENVLDDYLSYANLANNKIKAERIERVLHALNKVFASFMEDEVVQKANELRQLQVRKEAALGLKTLTKDVPFGGIIFSAAMQSYGKPYQDFIDNLRGLYLKESKKSNSLLRKHLVELVQKILRS